MTSFDRKVLASTISIDESRDAAVLIAQRMGWDVTDIASAHVSAKVPWSPKSFGEKVLIELSETQIVVTSQSSVGTTMADWGKNAENTSLFLQNFASYTDSIPTGTAEPIAAELVTPAPPPVHQQSRSSGVRVGFGETCPQCKSESRLITTRKFSTEGWFLFAASVCLFFPLAWVPFLIPQLYKTSMSCARCGYRYSHA